MICNKKFSPESLPDLTGRIAIVTGGNTGIGLPTVAVLAKKGAKVYLAARSEERGREAIEKIKKENPSSIIEYLKLDLSDATSIKNAVEIFKTKESSLHILINNAGIMATPYSENAEGIELQWATNYVGHFRLTNLLMPTLVSTARNAKTPGTVRVVNVSSLANQHMAPGQGIIFDDYNLKDSSTWTRYGQSKLANILHVKSLKKQYGHEGVWFASVHPGVVDTELKRGPQAQYGALGSAMFKVTGWFSYAPIEGAHPSLYCAASDQFTEMDSGDFFVPNVKKATPNKLGEDEAIADRLWEHSMKSWVI